VTLCSRPLVAGPIFTQHLTASLRALSAFLLFFQSPAATQTIRPVVVEYRGVAKGHFELLNNSLVPANVILEIKGFRITVSGEAIYQEIDSWLHVKLSATSLRIPPKQGRFVFYEAKADRLPSWFVVTCTFAGLPSRRGLNIDISLPHTVYLLQKELIEKPEIHIVRSQVLSGPLRLAVDLENTGPKLGRVTDWQVHGGRVKRTFGGFPLLPMGRRHLEVAWDGAEPPAKLLLRFQHFTLEKPVPSAP
jgi:hypothetical protein